MDNKIGLMVTISIAVILMGSLLVPIIVDANDDSQIVKTNMGNYADVLDYSTSADLSIAYTAATNEYVINGESQTLSGYGALAISDNFRLGYNGTSVYWAYYDGSTVRFGTGNLESFTITIADGVLTLVFGGTTTITPEWSKIAYLTNDESDPYAINLFFSGSNTIYVNSLDQIIAANPVASNTGFVSFINGAVQSFGVDAVANIGTSAVSGAESMLGLSAGPSGTLNVSVDGADNALLYVAVPKVVSSDTITSDAMAILYVIPVLLIASLVVMGAVVLFRR